MIKALKNRKAEGYIDVAIAVLVIVFLLVLALSVFKLVTLKQDMKYMCEELVKTATLNGKVGDGWTNGLKNSARKREYDRD